jgi:hypothetical protein
MKRSAAVASLLLCLCAFALFSLPVLSQDITAPSASKSASKSTPPPYCNPCLFYGGDFDPSNSKADSTYNMVGLTFQATTYVPFYIPAGQKWIIIGLFSNNLGTQDHIDPPQIQWSISSGMSAGNAGTLIASGTAGATWTATGRTFNGENEFTALGHLSEQTAVTLTGPGTYWMSAVPVCTGSEGLCLHATYSLTDVEDVPAPNHKGVEPGDDSFFTLPSENIYYEPTWPLHGACGGNGCNKFSAGLLGRAEPN